MVKKSGKKPPIELRRPPLGADLFVSQEAPLSMGIKPLLPLSLENSEQRSLENSEQESLEGSTERELSVEVLQERRSGKARNLSKSVIQRVSGRQLRRMTIYFEMELARSLAVYCAETDRELSEVVSIAVKQFLKKNSGLQHSRWIISEYSV